MWAAVVFLSFTFSISSSVGAGCYGNIMSVPTTGASCKTASQDRLNYCNTRASEKMAATDLKRMEKYKTKIREVGRELCVDAALIAGIISRETRAGAGLRNGWGDGGNAFGLMQVDKRYHKIVGTWDSKDHITQGTKILTDMIKAIKKKFPKWSAEQQLKGGIAAYNAGPGNIRSLDVDARTTGKDYSNDVVARAKYYKSKGY